MSCNYSFIILVMALIPQVAASQNPLSDRRQVEVGFGLATPFLQSGSELTRARELRANGQSYFQRADGSRREVGSYPRLIGFSVNLGFSQPLQRVDGLMLGATARTTLTGSQPSGSGYEEGYFFNTVTMGGAARYYPIDRVDLFLRGEMGLGAVLTKNRYRDDAGEQSFFHQFGIGPSGAVGIGYALARLGNRAAALEVQLLYQQLRTRVEVDGIGDDPWNSGALHLVVSTTF